MKLETVRDGRRISTTSSTCVRFSKTMSATNPWKIAPGATDWECDWRGDQLFHLRLFRSFPLAKKIRAVEEMVQVAEYFRKLKTVIDHSDGGKHAETQRR